MIRNLIILKLMSHLIGIVSSLPAVFEVSKPIAVKLPWMVTVYSTRVHYDMAFKSLPANKYHAFRKIICTGVIIDSNLIYVPGLSVEGLENDEMRVVTQSSHEEYAVKKIILSRKMYHRHHAVLLLRKPIKNAQIIPVLGPTDVADSSNCLVSDLDILAANTVATEPGQRLDATFRLFYPETCADCTAFITPYENTTSLTSGSTSQYKMHFASPLVCSSKKDPLQYMVVGYHAWSYPFEAKSPSRCWTDTKALQRLLDETVPSVLKKIKKKQKDKKSRDWGLGISS